MKAWMAVLTTHTNCIYVYCTLQLPLGMLVLCSIEILLSRRGVILLQEVTPGKGCLFQEVTWWDCVARTAASKGGISFLSTWAHAPQDMGCCKPTHFLFLCFCPKSLIRAAYGLADRTTNAPHPHNTTSCAYQGRDKEGELRCGVASRG